LPEALGYVRVSKEERGHKGYSVEDQIERIIEFALRSGWHLPKENIYVDDGYSGGFLERPALDGLRDRVDAGGISFAVACYRDRWSRGEDPTDMFVLTGSMKEKGCKLMTLDFSGDLNTPEGQLQADVLDSFARFEKAKIRERTRRGKRRRALDGRIVATTFVNFGFRLAETRDAYVVDPEAMAVVKRIFEMVGKEGKGMHSVSGRLMKAGIRAPRGGRKWFPKVLRDIVLSDVYLARSYSEVASLVSEKVAATLDPNKRYGIWWYGKRRHKLVGPRKVKVSEADPELKVPVPVPDCGLKPTLVLAARDSLASRRGTYVTDNVREWDLSGGFVLCSLCANRMGSNTGRNGTRYYRCNTRARFGELGCRGAKTAKADELEAEVWRRVKRAMTHPTLLKDALKIAVEEKIKAASRDPQRELGPLVKRATELEKKRTKIEDLVIEEVMTRERAKERLKAIDREIWHVRARMETLKTAQERAAEFEEKTRLILSWSIGHAQNNLDRLSSPQRRELYAALKIEVRVDEEGEVEVRWPLGVISEPAWTSLPSTSSNPANRPSVEALPPDLGTKSLSEREIVLGSEDALRAVDILAANGFAILGWEGWMEYPGGRIGHHEPWETFTAEAADFCRRAMNIAHSEWMEDADAADVCLSFCVTAISWEEHEARRL
jgi:site-specific DNA recombinase